MIWERELMLELKVAKRTAFEGGRFRFLPPSKLPLIETTKAGATPAFDSPRHFCKKSLLNFLSGFCFSIRVLRWEKFKRGALLKRFKNKKQRKKPVFPRRASKQGAAIAAPARKLVQRLKPVKSVRRRGDFQEGVTPS